MELTVKPIKPFQSLISVPGDKSISHRSVIIGSIANGITTIENFLPGQDCLSTVRCMRQLGVDIEQTGLTGLKVKGMGLRGLSEPDNFLDVGNSGTTIRLLSGLLAGQEFFSVLTGDASIRKRPMARVAVPLRQMGAKVWGRGGDRFAPLAIKGGPLKGIHYPTPVASAQVKSAVLLAGLYADGETAVAEPARSRDHTEKMLRAFGADIEVEGLTTVIKPGELSAQKVTVPGDISSAAFFLVAAAIIPGAKITVQKVGLNPTRTGILEVLEEMGAGVTITNQEESSGELMGDITVLGSSLKGVVVGGAMIPRLVDEIPVLAVAGAVAAGRTVIKDAAELKVKESNRLKAVAVEFSKFGVDIEETEDGLIINGGKKLTGAVCESYHDHRIAMACTLMGLVASGQTVVKDAECIDISFPGFEDVLNKL
ncbi:3-phosphoshikimate 1-carboxyvinyltransferase [Desulfolucanica intricata]|uniref:3-phosphoshikimate 1-carboxyvinyltransferase n=1 Tax=Desulfolucanica intricata TaxID=1285191 RepID=UPI003F758E21